MRWILFALRLALCAAALIYLYYNVSWNDAVLLSDAKHTRVHLVAVEAEQYTIEQNGVRRTIGPDDILAIDGQPQVLFGIHRIVTEMNFGLAWAAIVLFLPVPFLSALRLVWMLAIQNVKFGLWNAVKLTFAGNFFNFALPGTTGGDIFKAVYITRYTHRKTEAVTTIFLDRVIGLLGLMALATVLFVAAWDRLGWQPHYRNTLASGLAVIWGGLAVGAIFVFSARLRHMIRLPELAKKLPAGQQLLRVGRATVAMRSHKTLLALCLGNTIVLQLLVVFSAFAMARSLGMRGEFVLYFICVPLGFVIAALPISPPQAFGVLEYAYTTFFCQNGLNPASAAVAFALAVRLIQLFWAVPGVLVPLLGAHLPSPDEVAELQTEDAAPPLATDARP
jgi:glycosyltransferase 2 family protein